MIKRKQGENEALEILENIGIEMDEEYRNMLNLMPQWKWNGEANIFLYDIEKSPFQTIYVCEWDFENLIYNTVDPKMTRFYRNDGTLQWQYYRHKEFCEKVVQSYHFGNNFDEG